MGCDCKKAIELNENYGEAVEESIASKVIRLTKKAVIVLLVMLATLILTPVAIVYVMTMILFGKDRIVLLPKIVSKYAFKKNG